MEKELNILEPVQFPKGLIDITDWSSERLDTEVRKPMPIKKEQGTEMLGELLCIRENDKEEEK